MTNDGEPAAWLMPVGRTPRERLLASGDLRPPADGSPAWGTLPDIPSVADDAPSVEDLLAHERGDR